MGYQQTHLWQSAFSQNKETEHFEMRDFLKNQLLSMRDKVSSLISRIPSDCKDLTVHDITHIDTLWETAQLICGESWEINPAEAFVFGAAVLVHDAALTTLAYPNGKTGLQSTSLWADVSAQYQTATSEQGNNSHIASTIDNEPLILFEVLRKLHAEQAAELCTRSWSLPEGRGEIYLIDDCELRESFGESIGRIARSHHWDTEKLQYELADHLGGSPKLPQEWTINEIKLACLLRCADAAQIDRTRAPIMLYAALGPKGYSKLHWQAQLKLNRPSIKKDSIHFSSSSKYSSAESDAWWVAFDLAKILDKELRASNAILTTIEENSFLAQRVAGIDSPRTFSNYVKTDKWRPIDASIRITDPLHIAQTLGGKNLYGSSAIVPFRELIQNATDAIRARRIIENRGQDFGTIQITIEHHPQNEDLCLLHIDDNGIGMSERVLCTTLVDFGKSFWNSTLLCDEFPGLKGAKINHIGKFGIGFFSIFELSHDVKVTSRRYDSGYEATNSLEFRGLVTRPLLCKAHHEDIPKDFCTRITLSINKSAIQNKWIIKDPYYQRHFSGIWYDENYEKFSLKNALISMCAFLNVEVLFSDRRNGDNFSHLPHIYEKESSVFIDELLRLKIEKNCVFFDPDKSIQPIRSENGDSFGRAALDIDNILHRRRDNRGYISISGISTISSGNDLILNDTPIPYYGIVEGRTDRAARDFASICLPEAAIKDWLKCQLQMIDENVLNKSELMQIASFALSTGIPSQLPIAFHQWKTLSATELVKIISEVDSFYLPVNWRYEAWPEIIGYHGILPEYFDTPLVREVIVLSNGHERLLEEDDARTLKKEAGGPIDGVHLMQRWKNGRVFFNLLKETWKSELKFELRLKPIFSTKIISLSQQQWVLVVSKSEKLACK